MSWIVEQFGTAITPLCSTRAVAVHLRDDERHVGLHPPRRGLVDRDRAAAHGVGDELPRRRRSDREEADVEAAGGERIRRRFLDAPCRQLGAGRARRREVAHVVPVLQQLAQDAADRARRADDADC